MDHALVLRPQGMRTFPKPTDEIVAFAVTDKVFRKDNDWYENDEIDLLFGHVHRFKSFSVHGFDKSLFPTLCI